jgi:glycosyltransferase involved in cell wall biosynthesis
MTGRNTMRILHVLGKLDRGGVETWLVQVLQNIDRHKYQMDFLVHTTDPGAYDEEVRGLGSRIHPCLSPSNPLQYAFNFRRILNQYGPYDVVHSHVHHFSGYVLMLAAMAGVKVRIAHSHNDTRTAEVSNSRKRRAYLQIMKAMIRSVATHGLAVSAEAGCDLFPLRGRNTEKWELQHLGIDLSRFDVPANAHDVRQSLGIPPDALVVGHVGRFSDQKNHAFLVDIAREFVRTEPRGFFLLVGDGLLRPAIEEKVRNYGLAKHFMFAGLRSDVATLMKGAMDALLFPSLYEGLPITLIEAQAAELRCLISNVISVEADVVPELIRRESLDRTPAEWASSLLELLSHRLLVSPDAVREALASRSIGTSRDALLAFYLKTPQPVHPRHSWTAEKSS